MQRSLIFSQCIDNKFLSLLMSGTVDSICLTVCLQLLNSFNISGMLTLLKFGKSTDYAGVKNSPERVMVRVT